MKKWRSSEGWQSLPLVHVWRLTVCAENVLHSFLYADIYGLKTVPLQRLLLLRLAKPVILIQLYTITLPLCSNVYDKHAEFLGC